MYEAANDWIALMDLKAMISNVRELKRRSHHDGGWGGRLTRNRRREFKDSLWGLRQSNEHPEIVNKDFLLSVAISFKRDLKISDCCCNFHELFVLGWHDVRYTISTVIFVYGLCLHINGSIYYYSLSHVFNRHLDFRKVFNVYCYQYFGNTIIIILIILMKQYRF